MSRLGDWLIDGALRRDADFVIGGDERPYLLRWFVIPRNPLFNVYLHRFLRSDDDRALHTHPWVNLSVLLRGNYVEHTATGAHRRVEGALVFRRSGKIAHRIELTEGAAWSLFITGPRYRQWGFLCPQGFVHWRDFTAPGDKGSIGRGCD